MMVQVPFPPGCFFASGQRPRDILSAPDHQGVTSGFTVERYFLTTVGKSQRAF
jgi:hypothetical protein